MPALFHALQTHQLDIGSAIALLGELDAQIDMALHFLDDIQGFLGQVTYGVDILDNPVDMTLHLLGKAPVVGCLGGLAVLRQHNLERQIILEVEQQIAAFEHLHIEAFAIGGRELVEIFTKTAFRIAFTSGDRNLIGQSILLIFTLIGDIAQSGLQ